MEKLEKTKEHILVCLSYAPSDSKIVCAAAAMAEAFGGQFTALYVEMPEAVVMAEQQKKCLRENMKLAKQLGAKCETVYGTDMPLQIAEYAGLSGVTQIVIGKSDAVRKRILGQPSLMEKLMEMAPNLEIHVIPDNRSGNSTGKTGHKTRALVAKDVLTSILIFLLATALGAVFWHLRLREANIVMIYILAVMLTAVLTSNKVYSMVSAAVSVIAFNYLFTEPMFSMSAYEKDYPFTFLVMFIAAFLTSSLAVRLKEQARRSVEAAYRTEILLETNQLLEQAREKREILQVTASQLIKLLGRDLTICFAEEGEPIRPKHFPVNGGRQQENQPTDEERDAVEWVIRNCKPAGAGTEFFSGAKCLHLPIYTNENAYGTVGIAIGRKPLDAFENSMLLAIIGECTLALENEKNRREKEKADELAQKEQFRANLLRSISHDLRTPLTAISGNVSNLLSNGRQFDEETIKEIYSDIYEDAMWLINMTENLLFVTRIENGRINLHLSTELMGEVIEEALQHVNREKSEHEITVEASEEYIFARIDVRLIVQVIINIMNNAVKYTQKGSQIHIAVNTEEDKVAVTISDNGPGIPEEKKQHIFDMFCGSSRTADSRRSLGLGLSLCKSIIYAHGGEIWVSDNVPRGTVFKFTLPIGEVTLHE